MRGVTRALVLGMVLGGPAMATPDAPESTSTVPAPFTPFEHLVGAWKGMAIPATNRLKGWTERHLWAWKFADGQPVGMTLTIEGGKVLAKGQLLYDATTRAYRLEGTDPSGKPVAFTGAWDAPRKTLVLDRAEASPGAKERLSIRLNSNLIRYTMWLDRREPGAPQFAKVIDINPGKEGEAFAASGSAVELPKCIITGGAATLSVTHEGKTYPLCCTGCRDEFLDNPAKYVQKALLQAQDAVKTKVKTASSASVGKDDGAFDGLVDDPSPTKHSPKPAAQPKVKADPPRDEPPTPSNTKPAMASDPASKASSLFRSAQSLDKLGKTSAALGYYRQIVAKYPDAPQAKPAAARIKELSK
jgi:YHS domain-containing protein